MSALLALVENTEGLRSFIGDDVAREAPASDPPLGAKAGCRSEARSERQSLPSEDLLGALADGGSGVYNLLFLYRCLEATADF